MISDETRLSLVLSSIFSPMHALQNRNPTSWNITHLRTKCWPLPQSRAVCHVGWTWLISTMRYLDAVLCTNCIVRLK
jgi:hypothetical protein